MEEVKKAKEKGFWARWVVMLDMKMEESTKSKPCCGSDSESKGGSCCSR